MTAEDTAELILHLISRAARVKLVRLDEVDKFDACGGDLNVLCTSLLGDGGARRRSLARVLEKLGRALPKDDGSALKVFESLEYELPSLRDRIQRDAPIAFLSERAPTAKSRDRRERIRLWCENADAG